jgi:hypothetical protein
MTMLRNLHASVCRLRNIVLVGLVQTPTLLAQAPGQLARPPFETTKVEGTDHVYIFRYQNHQGMFVVTSAGVIATDPIGYGQPQAVTTYLEEMEKTIFAVDFISVGSVPGRGMIDAYPLEWEDSLKQVMAVDWERLVQAASHL